MATTPTYIVLYLSRLGVGGIQTFVIQLAEALAAYPDLRVAVFCHDPELADRSMPPFPEGVELWTLSENAFAIKVVNKVRNFIKTVAPNRDLKEWLTQRYFLRQLRRHNVAVVHNNIQVGDENVAVARERLGIPYLTTLHGAYKHVLTESISAAERATLIATLKRLLRTASTLVYLSADNLLPFRELLPEVNLAEQLPLVQVRNGLRRVPVSRPTKTSEGGLVFGMVARGHPIKGWRELMEAAEALIAEGHTDFQLLLYADGNHVEELMAERTWSPQIQYRGMTRTPLEEIVTFDVGLLPSYAEEMPFTIIEYLACQKPCIATKVGAVSDMLTTPDGDTAGLLIDLDSAGRPDHEQLKEALRTCLTQPERLAAFGRAAAQAFEPFDIQHTAEAYYKLYQNAIQQ